MWLENPFGQGKAYRDWKMKSMWSFQLGVGGLKEW